MSEVRWQANYGIILTPGAQAFTQKAPLGIDTARDDSYAETVIRCCLWHITAGSKGFHPEERIFGMTWKSVLGADLICSAVILANS